MLNKGNLRIFCPTHEAAFEVVNSPKIICEITEHALSVGFPNSEFWEFCCNCETFAPSRSDKGEKARNNCPSCGNEISKRFVCADCKIISFESEAQTKGKSYSINANGIEPACPGCQGSAPADSPALHHCSEIEAKILTARSECPFCWQKTVSVKEQKTISSEAKTIQVCPKCRSVNPTTSSFCGKCRHQLRDDVTVAELGTDVNKTQLLGSLCPNCGAPVPPGSDFCGECGQAVKKAAAAAPPPPPPPPKKPSANVLSFGAPTSEFVDSASNNNTRNILIIVGAVVAFFAILGVISSNSKSSGGSTYNSNAYSNSTVISNSNQSNNTSMSGNISPRISNDYRIGKTGALNTNARIRSASNQFAQILGVHYRGAKIRVLDVESYTTNEGDATWFRVKVLENGCDSEGVRGCGNDNPNAADGYGWMQASDEGWINAKTINLQ